MYWNGKHRLNHNVNPDYTLSGFNKPFTKTCFSHVPLGEKKKKSFPLFFSPTYGTASFSAAVAPSDRTPPARGVWLRQNQFEHSFNISVVGGWAGWEGGGGGLCSTPGRTG